MSTHLLLFSSSFAAVFALGFQSLNVNQGHYLAAAATSLAIGAAHVALYRLMPDASLTQMVAYLAGGPLGITASMWAHRRTVGRNGIRTLGNINPPPDYPSPPAPPPPPLHGYQPRRPARSGRPHDPPPFV